MSGDNVPDNYVGELEVIHKVKSGFTEIDVVIVHGMGQDPRECWMTDSADEQNESSVLRHIHKQTNARIMLFNSKVKDGVNPLSTDSLTQISKLLLKELSLLRSGNDKDERIPIAFIAHDLGGAIVKKALVLAESDTNCLYFSIAQDVIQLIFIDVVHRALKPIFSSSLIPPQTNFSANELQEFSISLERLSVDFVSLHTWRYIINVYKDIDGEAKDANPDAAYYSATTGLVHEINIPRQPNPNGLFNLSKDGFAISTIIRIFNAGNEPDYQKSLSYLEKASPMFTIPDDQYDLFMSEPGVEVQSAYRAWLETSLSPRFIATSGAWGAGKSLNARTLFRKLKRQSSLVAYFSFSAIDASKGSFESFLASVIFQFLNQDPGRYLKVADSFIAMEYSDIWAETALLQLFPVRNGGSLAKLKVAIFYNVQAGSGNDIEERVKAIDQFGLCKPLAAPPEDQAISSTLGHDLTLDMFKPLAAPVADQAISSSPYLSDLRQDLIATLEKCKNTTEMLLIVQSLVTDNLKAVPHTPKTLKALISSSQIVLSDVVSDTFKSLPGWGRAALGWIVYSKRPLRLNELAVAVALTNDKAKFSSSLDAMSLHADFGVCIQFLFGPLVSFKGGGIIFNDKAVRDHFVKLIEEERACEPAEKSLPKVSTQGDAESLHVLKAIIPGDAEIAGILLGYLSWQNFICPLDETFQLETFIRPQGGLFALMNYAVRFLPFHYSACLGISKSFQPSQLAMWSRLYSKLNGSFPAPCLPTHLLHTAAIEGFAEIFKAVGGNIERQYRNVVIRLACEAGHLDIVRELMASGGGAFDVAEALRLATVRGHADVVDFIVAYMKDKTPQSLLPLVDQLLYNSVTVGSAKQVALYISIGANVNAVTENDTPLQSAVFDGHEQIVQLLLQCEGVSVNSRGGTSELEDPEYDNPLIFAAMNSHELIVQHLLDAKADIKCVNSMKETPIAPCRREWAPRDCSASN
ncbi:hypothetical protein TrVGV298_005105 [Trichoderma virens]|nr:hypothetical protein TrVGV298_005105 [Trichoderma virens]